jgi:Tfp pilus assembly protein PilV
VSARGAPGFALVDALVALSLLLLGTLAVTGMIFATTRAGRQAAYEGRRAAAAVRAADRVRSGLAPGDSGAFVVTVAGDSFAARYVRRAVAATGALELSVRPPGGGVPFVFEAATPEP